MLVCYCWGYCWVSSSGTVNWMTISSFEDTAVCSCSCSTGRMGTWTWTRALVASSYRWYCYRWYCRLIPITDHPRACCCWIEVAESTQDHRLHFSWVQSTLIPTFEKVSGLFLSTIRRDWYDGLLRVACCFFFSQTKIGWMDLIYPSFHHRPKERTQINALQASERASDNNGFVY